MEIKIELPNHPKYQALVEYLKKRTLYLIKRIISEKFTQKWQLNNIQYHSQCGTQIKPIFAIMFDSNIELLCVTLQNLLHPNIVARQPRFHFHNMEINDSNFIHPSVLVFKKSIGWCQHLYLM